MLGHNNLRLLVVQEAEGNQMELTSLPVDISSLQLTVTECRLQMLNSKHKQRPQQRHHRVFAAVQ